MEGVPTLIRELRESQLLVKKVENYAWWVQQGKLFTEIHGLLSGITIVWWKRQRLLTAPLLTMLQWWL